MVSRPYVTVRGIIYHQDKLFLQKLITKSGINTFWSTPGGKLDEGEDLISGLRREMIEETGITPMIGRLLFLQQFMGGDGREWLEFFYLIENAEDYAVIDLKCTTHGEVEVSECGFVNPKTATMLPKDLANIDVKSYVDEIKPVLLMNYL